MTIEQYNKLASWSTGSTGVDANDMLYREFIDGPQGGKFELLREEHHTHTDIERAKIHLRRNFDVVSIHLISEEAIY